VTAPVGIGIVNRDGRDLLLRCLESLAQPGLDVVVVDNASSDGSATAVRERFPDVRVVEAGRNLGYAAGANLALVELAQLEYIALLNNDTVVEPGWLEPLVAALDEDPGLGAAAPKILFEGKFVEVSLAHGRVTGVRVDGRDEWRRTQFVHGWHPAKLVGGEPVRQASGEALLRTPPGDAVELRVDGEWRQVERGEPVDVVNNVGSILVAGGYGADRGFQEVDAGWYDKPAEVFAWCGAAVLLRRAYLDDVGELDERLFLYYEDFDLSWRGQARGWRYRYVPDSVVRHVHTASSVEGSALFDFYVERNRLLVHARNAPGGYAARVALSAFWTDLVIFRREVLRPLLTGTSPDSTLFRRRMGAFLAFLTLLPAALLDRRRLRRGQQRPYKEQMKWLVPL
jgi:GT2 family glycosyltransferase